MENLLKNDFINHYGLAASAITNISQQTNATYFELEDDNNRETQIFEQQNNGTAIYNNPNQKEITIINYDKFVTSLPAQFQQDRKRCDLIVYTANSKDYFLLNELKDANIKSGRRKAKKQLKSSLTDLLAVESINNFVIQFINRRCCIFNKRSISPSGINVIAAFNRLQSIVPNGMKLNCTDIENRGFELWEYLGGNQLNIN